ncbi:MAG: 16S rRNA (uracil(1498)-N(3))-methyltransferase [Chitinophagaceae bacterium]
MSLPFFYIESIAVNSFFLDEATSKHITQVLRMKVHDEVVLTDGKGTKAQAAIANDNRKRCEVKISSVEKAKESNLKVAIAISLIKNTFRFEWFLEKATEIGVSEIVPIICERTEKQNFRLQRMNGIVISAMLQSQQFWLPVLHEPVNFKKLITSNPDKYNKKLIAYYSKEDKPLLTYQLANGLTNQLILIGPEGDFTPQEIEMALKIGFEAVSLGKTRLRTETAGIVAATLLCNAITVADH